MTLWDKIAAWYHQSVFYELFRHLSENVFGVHFEESYENIAVSASAEQTVRALILALMFGAIFSAAAVVYTKTVPCGFLRRLLSMGATSPDRAVTLLESGYFRSVGVRSDLKRGGMLAKFLCRPDDDGRTVAGTTPAAETAEEIAKEAANGEEGKPSLLERLNAPDRRPAAVSEQQPTKQTDETSEAKKANEADETPSEPEPLRPVNFLSDRFYIPEVLRVRAELRCEKTGWGFRGFLAVTVLAVAAAALFCRAIPFFLTLADRMMG